MQIAQIKLSKSRFIETATYSFYNTVVLCIEKEIQNNLLVFQKSLKVGVISLKFHKKLKITVQGVLYATVRRLFQNENHEMYNFFWSLSWHCDIMI